MWAGFEYFKPATLEEACSLLAKYGSEAVIFAGGTDLLVSMRAGGIRPKYLIDIKGIQELSRIKLENGRLTVGVAVTVNALARSDVVKKEFNILIEAAKLFASAQIRNRATIGGNLCRASPSSDMVPPLLVLDAMLTAVSTKGERNISVKDFFIGPEKTCLEQGELLKDIQVQTPPKDMGTAFLKIRRTGVDLAVVNVAVALVVGENKFKDVRIALGAVAPTPMRAYKAEAQLKGEVCTDENIDRAAETASGETNPITDVRSTAEYRREVSKVLVKRAIKNALLKVGGV